MRIKLVLVLINIMLLTPSVAAQAEVEGRLSIADSSATGTDISFNVELNDFVAETDALSVFTVSEASATDIKSIQFEDPTGWVTLTHYANPSVQGEVIAKFIFDTGHDVDGKRVVPMRINFHTPKDYILGYSIQTSDNRILSSTAAPIRITGQVLGITTSVPSYTYIRSLTYGLSGDDVIALQERLTAEGVYTGPITGFFGRLTQTAVRKFQALKGVRPTNGVFGPATQAAMNQ